MVWTKSKRAEYMRDYRLKNLTKMRALYKKYRVFNRKNILVNDQKYYQKNRNKRIEYARRYYIKHRERIRRYNQARDVRRKTNNPLTVETLQKIYEDNIKHFGTLTCYLCRKPIKFGQDSIDHKTPIHRGGDNNKTNLGIAHLQCNKQKHTRTFEEYILSKPLQISES